MPKQIMVTRNNAERFRDWQDAVTMEHFTLGDTVVRCAACGAVFHRRNVRETCLICQKPFVAGEVRTQTMHLTRGKRVKLVRCGHGNGWAPGCARSAHAAWRER